ncbi:hypothetical protein GBA52_001075 [Prunus armeniaca]|nr:hypothetical protein GBA52_001075 [Prunus armeniaca]
MVNMVSISIGVAIAAYGEARFDTWGHCDPNQLVWLWPCILGVAYYNHSKLQALKAKEAQKKTALADEEANRLLEDREGEGIGKRNESQN